MCNGVYAPMRVTAVGLAPDASSEAGACGAPRSAASWSGRLPAAWASGSDRARSIVTTSVSITVGNMVFCDMVNFFSRSLQRVVPCRIAELFNLGQPDLVHQGQHHVGHRRACRCAVM